MYLIQIDEQIINLNQVTDFEPTEEDRAWLREHPEPGPTGPRPAAYLIGRTAAGRIAGGSAVGHEG